jgi:hypothetical protein
MASTLVNLVKKVQGITLTRAEKVTPQLWTLNPEPKTPNSEPLTLDNKPCYPPKQSTLYSTP